jgi:hypothetical protein
MPQKLIPVIMHAACGLFVTRAERLDFGALGRCGMEIDLDESEEAF